MVRLGFAAFAFLLLLIPIALVQNIIDERTNNRDQAKFDIAQGWGQAQTIGGPWLVVPTTHLVTTTASDPSQKKPSVVALQILAETTTISATIAPELRTRGIYEVPVYTATVIIEGKLPKNLAKHVPDDTVADWSMAALHVNIADLAAVRETLLEVDGTPVEVQAIGEGGGFGLVMGRLPGTAAPDAQKFRMTLRLAGTSDLFFLPNAESFEATISGNWSSPSFQGRWLPETRQIDDEAFTAKWSISALARASRSSWLGSGDLHEQVNSLGVSLATGVDSYRLIDRSLKYAALMIGITLLMTWLFEIRSGRLLHPIQHLITGSALAVFYLVELSASEHIGFAGAYCIATLLIATLQAEYVRLVLGTIRPAFSVWLTYAVLYGLLFAVLRNDDYALLGGTALVVAIIYITMRTTKNLHLENGWLQPDASSLADS